MIWYFDIVVSLLPVLVFLAALVFLDSYKLVRPRSVLAAIVSGAAAAGIALLIHSLLLDALGANPLYLSRYLAPGTEEVVKTGLLIYLLKTHRIGFVVDAAVYGFAIGAGFAMVENIYYLNAMQQSGLLLWVIRGLGTAAMHGCTTAIVGMVAKRLADHFDSPSVLMVMPGLTAAIVLHSVYNHFVLPPVVSTVVLLSVFPVMMIIIFTQSEKATQNWLGVGMDTDLELLEAINSGRILETRVGKYLESLNDRFPVGVVADMYCLLRIHLDLSLQAKGILLMQRAGYQVSTDPEFGEKLSELKFLEKSIGITGRFAIRPFLRTSSRDLWQLHMLKSRLEP